MAQSRLQAQVEALRTRKETIKATYTAAEAQTRINEAVSGLGDEMGDVGTAIQRAEDKTAQMQARASAIDKLIASGALDDATSLNRGDDITRELEAMSSQAEVEAELARLKGSTNELPAADAPEAIEAAPTPGEILAEGRSPSRWPRVLPRAAPRERPTRPEHQHCTSGEPGHWLWPRGARPLPMVST